ncbi:MAG: inositol 2-dehydrogenase [bacterium]
MTKKLKVGVIGAGRIGRIHAENLSFRIPEAEVAMISDVKPESARAAAEEFHIPRAVQDYHEILENRDIGAVAICSPTNTHARIIEESAARKMHIFCEKPVDLDVETIRKALCSVEKAGVKFQVGFNRRYDSNFRRAKEWVGEGKVGTPHVVRITSRDPAPPPLEYLRGSGGIFLDMTIHDFDMARYLVNDDIVEVWAAGDCLVNPEIRDIGDIDTAVVTMRYKSGALCVIDNSRKAVYGYDQRAEVFGSKGCITVANNTPSNTGVWDESGQKREPFLFFFLERYRDAYVAEMREFVDCVLMDKQPSSTGVDGLKAVILGLAAQKSLREGRTVRVDGEKIL